MLKLVADREVCKGCACVVTAPCFLKGVPAKSILIAENRYYDEEEIRDAVRKTINACPLRSVELRDANNQKIEV